MRGYRPLARALPSAEISDFSFFVNDGIRLGITCEGVQAFWAAACCGQASCQVRLRRFSPKVSRGTFSIVKPSLTTAKPGPEKGSQERLGSHNPKMATDCLKIADFAKLCGKSLSSFKREFKNKFNTTPSRWLINKRLDHSKTLLLGTNLTVSEVGYECGFKNNSHFIQAFKKVAKVTPNSYRILKKEA